MVAAIWLLVGLMLGSAVVFVLQRTELQTLRKEKQQAEDRLYYAWRDEKVVPAPRTQEPAKIEPLPKALQDAVNDWESPEGRAATESKIRFMLSEGKGEVTILKALETTKYG